MKFLAVLAGSTMAAGPVTFTFASDDGLAYCQVKDPSFRIKHSVYKGCIKDGYRHWTCLDMEPDFLCDQCGFYPSNYCFNPT
ncbi:uncharacterized protein PFL1_03565 [Pseudozyma flocculosa PF-1]|uniref:Uncharacterized protein n=1 Tax=Pseudozyma flocculosa PF-1 TaxID=1277687 RepID=A0A061H780_9BASI|nr:uncharacterized protein PFL1_03565 [Pseudozyma flocculosa PF-1]EPQ28762.1 hypothetical protein PFL1_03565 [Pseudozyma flocculosa PF-1]